MHNDIPLSPFIFFFKIFFPLYLVILPPILQLLPVCLFLSTSLFFLCRELWPTELYPWHPCSLLRGSASVPVSLNRREQRSREIQSMVKARKSAVRYGGEGERRRKERRQNLSCASMKGQFIRSCSGRQNILPQCFTDCLDEEWEHISAVLGPGLGRAGAEAGAATTTWHSPITVCRKHP